MQASMNSRIEMCLDGGPTRASLTYETAVFMCILFTMWLRARERGKIFGRSYRNSIPQLAGPTSHDPLRTSRMMRCEPYSHLPRSFLSHLTSSTALSSPPFSSSSLPSYTSDPPASYSIRAPGATGLAKGYTYDSLGCH